MKKIISFYILSFAILLSLVAYQGCSKLEDNLVAPNKPGVHPAGWTNPHDMVHFHGKYIASQEWNLTQCQSCHGADYRGGTTGLSCYKCHKEEGGPVACNTCHGDPHDITHPYPPYDLNGDSLETDARVGAHFHHLNKDFAPDDQRKYRPVACIECHETVHSFADTSHIDPNRHGRAHLVFGPLAKDSTGWGGQHPNPTYDSSTHLCSNVYCHGSFMQGNVNFKPKFNNPESVKCGSCHGDSATGNPTPGAPNNIQAPHQSNFWTDTLKLCFACHTQTIDMNGNIIGDSLHINGVVDVNQAPFNINNYRKSMRNSSSYFKKPGFNR
jgi:predicted CxxxxCH...CXXCH cytochrome family protein